VLFGVQHIVSHEVDLDAADGHQVRPLHLAAINNHCHVVKFLVDKGANVTRPDVDGDLPAHWAATKGQQQVIIREKMKLFEHHSSPSCPLQQLLCQLLVGFI
jgi:ankyrin repeat protein